MRAVQAGAAAAAVREARLATAARIVALAGEHRADALLLAGDTFEDNAVEPLLVRRIVEILGRARCPVFVLPGNHDPLGPASVFRLPCWRETPQVRVLDSGEPV